MGLNLTKLHERMNNLKRKLYYSPDITIKFFSINKLLLEVTPEIGGWFIRTATTTNLSLGVEYFEASIALSRDDVDLEKIIPNTDNILVGLDKYILAQYFRPRAQSKLWRLRLESSGKYKHG